MGLARTWRLAPSPAPGQWLSRCSKRPGNIAGRPVCLGNRLGACLARRRPQVSSPASAESRLET